MPLAPVIASQLTPLAREITLYIGGRDLTSLTELESIWVEDSAANNVGSAQFRLKAALIDLPEVYDQALTRIVDNVAGTDIFRGYVTSRRPTTGLEPMVEIRADDIGGLLDTAYIPYESRPAETFQARIGSLWGRYAGAHLSGDLSLVQNLGSLSARIYEGMTLRQAIEDSAAEVSAGSEYYVATDTRLHVFSSEALAAPYDVIVGTPGAGEIAPESLDIDYEAKVYGNQAYVQGGTPAGSGLFPDNGAIAAANGLVRTHVIQAPESETASVAAAMASAYLARLKTSTTRGTFRTRSPYDGWRSGQTVRITEPNYGFSNTAFPIRSVLITLEATETGFGWKYEVSFGGLTAGGAAGPISGFGGGQLVRVPFNFAGTGIFDSTESFDVFIAISERVNIIAEAKAWLRFRQFWAPATAASSGGASTPTSSSGGSQTPTSGASSASSSGDTGLVYNLTTCPFHASHSHITSITDHAHGIAHTHTVTVAAHDHTVTISPHTHDLTYGIYKETLPASWSVTLTVYRQVGSSWTQTGQWTGLTDETEEVNLASAITGPGLWRLTVQSAGGQPNGGRLAVDVTGQVLGAIASI